MDHVFGLDLGWLILLAVIGAAFDPMGLSGREAMLPDVAAAAGMKLERVNGIHEAIWGVAFLVGPGVGGFLIATVGAVNAMWAAAVGFTASSVLVCVHPAPEPARTGPPAVAHGADPAEPGLRRGSIWRETVDGIAIVWNDRLLRAGRPAQPRHARHLPAARGGAVPRVLRGAGRARAPRAAHHGHERRRHHRRARVLGVG